MPLSSAAWIDARAASSSTGPHSPLNSQVPRQIGVTLSPLRPSSTVSMSVSFHGDAGCRVSALPRSRAPGRRYIPRVSKRTRRATRLGEDTARPRCDGQLVEPGSKRLRPAALVVALAAQLVVVLDF